MNVQWAPKGSYRLENMLSMVEKLPNRYNMFSNKDFAIYVLDDYSVHLQTELCDALLKKGYILIIIGGGVTGDIQVNDTHYHHQLKQKYRDLESDLMIRKLRAETGKVPSPTRDDMMCMLNESWNATCDHIDPILALKNNFIMNALDGSEDFLVRETIKNLVGEEIVRFRNELMRTPPPKSLKELIKSITPPKGVIRLTKNDKPDDEGQELLDCEGEEIMPNNENETDEVNSEEEESEIHVAENTDSSTSQDTNEKIDHITDLPATSNDEKVNQDINFINSISTVVRQYQGKTSTLFLPYLSQFKSTVASAKRSLKKRLHSEQFQVRLL